MFAAHMKMWDASEIPAIHLVGVSIIMNQPLSGWFTCCIHLMVVLVSGLECLRKYAVCVWKSSLDLCITQQGRRLISVACTISNPGIFILPELPWLFENVDKRNNSKELFGLI